MFCSKSGKEIRDDAVTCIHCGCKVEGRDLNPDDKKSWVVSLLLCLFLGGIGAHRFYTGYIGIGVAQLLTLGGCGIWAFIDLICILCNSYKAADGSYLQK